MKLIALLHKALVVFPSETTDMRQIELALHWTLLEKSFDRCTRRIFGTWVYVTCHFHFLTLFSLKKPNTVLESHRYFFCSYSKCSDQNFKRLKSLRINSVVLYFLMFNISVTFFFFYVFALRVL